MRSGILVVVVFWLLWGQVARGGVADWRVNEVFPAGGDPPNPSPSSLRYVELWAPPSAEIDNCFFPTTRLEIYGPTGLLLGAVAPFEATRCFPGDTYFLFATPEAGAAFGVTPDAALTTALPADAGQVCLASSQTRYDCARWGNVTSPIPYFRNVDDETSAPGIPGGVSLARRADTGVVADDFVLMAPTPGRLNDGTVVPAPDAGPPPPDAPPRPDAAMFPDAPPFPPADARVFPIPPDAAIEPAFLTARPGGGGCSVAGDGPAPVAAILMVLVGLWRPRSASRRSLKQGMRIRNANAECRRGISSSLSFEFAFHIRIPCWFFLHG